MIAPRFLLNCVVACLLRLDIDAPFPLAGTLTLMCTTSCLGNRAAQALRMAAQALRKSQTALGAHHRRLCSRMDKPKAITASAHKLARLVYFMLTKGQAFVEAGQDDYEERYRQRVVQNLTRRAHQLGFQLTPQETSSA